MLRLLVMSLLAVIPLEARSAPVQIDFTFEVTSISTRGGVGPGQLLPLGSGWATVNEFYSGTLEVESAQLDGSSTPGFGIFSFTDLDLMFADGAPVFEPRPGRPVSNSRNIFWNTTRGSVQTLRDQKSDRPEFSSIQAGDVYDRENATLENTNATFTSADAFSSDELVANLIGSSVSYQFERTQVTNVFSNGSFSGFSGTYSVQGTVVSAATQAVVPLPPSIPLLAGGVALLAWVRSRRQGRSPSS